MCDVYGLSRQGKGSSAESSRTCSADSGNQVLGIGMPASCATAYCSRLLTICSAVCRARDHETEAGPEQLLVPRDEQRVGISRGHEHSGIVEAVAHEPQDPDPCLWIVVHGREGEHLPIAGVAPEVALALQQQDGNAAPAQAAGEAEGVP